jgi:hypothetical protein
VPTGSQLDAGSEAVFLGYIDRRGGHCWPWTGPLSAQGYGIFGPARTSMGTRLAHRIHWIMAFGAIEQGLVLDHLCHVRHCVRLSHLEPVTRAQNTLRGFSPPAVNARKIVGDCGHRLTEVVTRACLVCRKTRRHVSLEPSSSTTVHEEGSTCYEAPSPLERLAEKWGYRPIRSSGDPSQVIGFSQNQAPQTPHRGLQT